MTTKLRAAISATALTLSAALLTGCGASLPAQTDANHSDALATLDLLDSATSIELKKDTFSIGDHWSVKVDGKEIATIEGLDLPTYGDTYTALSPEGGIMGGEEEKIFNMAKTAKFFDSNSDTTGTLTKEIFSFMAKYHLEDSDGNNVASLEQKFSWGLKGDIKDSDGTVWEMKGALMSVSPKLTLTRKDSDSKLEPIEAILMAVVASEIYEAENNDK